jgi:hypothetical protein
MSRPSTHELRPKPRRRSMRRAVWVVLGVLGPACTFDPDDRCGPNQVAWITDERCVCAEGTAYTEAGCVPCGEHEVATQAGCACETGYGRPTPTDSCSPLPEGIGLECSTDAQCVDPAYPHCQASVGGTGYCTTQNCSEGAACNGGYSCNAVGSPTFCQRPPVAAGRPCATDADCAGTDALFCDTVVSFTCLVRDCLTSAEGCFPGFECCDLTSFGIPAVCLAVGLCQQ